MLRTYQAVIVGNTIHWLVPPPIDLEGNKEIPVDIIIKLDEKTSMQQGTAMYNALFELSKINGTLSSIKDPSEWQREVRKDKELIR